MAKSKFVHKNGKFVSPLKAYPGFIQLPYPFLGLHYKTWIKASRELETAISKKGMAEIEVGDLPAFREWQGALSVVEFHLENIAEESLKDASGDSVPMCIQSWVRQCCGEYLAEQLDLKNLLDLSEISSMAN